MSKYLGKILLDAKIVTLHYCYVKYVKKTNRFAFSANARMFTVGADLCYALASLRGMLDFQYQWSIGYVVKEKKGVEYLGEMRKDELELLGGRKKLVLSGQLDNDEDFDILCAIQYKYKLSVSELDRIKRHWRRSHQWNELSERNPTGGRKVGSKNKVRSSDSKYTEPLEDLLLRCEHNKKVAKQKGFLEWYIDACKEECKALNQKFDKEQVLKQWKEQV